MFLYAGVPEWSNGTDSRSVGLVPTKVRILSPAWLKEVCVVFVQITTR